MRWIWALGAAGCAADRGPVDPGGTEAPTGGSTSPSISLGGQIGETSTTTTSAERTLYVYSGPEVLAGGPPRIGVPLGTECGHEVVGPGDLDGDGVPDLGVACLGHEDRIAFYSGADPAAPPFAEVWFSTGPSNLPSVVGDLDGDGRSELAFTAAYDAPDGRWAAVVAGADVAGTVDAEAVGWLVDGGPDDHLWRLPAPAGDVDGDGILDLAFGISQVPQGSIASSSVHLIRGSSFGGTPEAYAVIDLPVGVADESLGIGDLDGDGRDDLLVVPRPWGDGVTLIQSAMYVVSGASPVASLADAPRILGPSDQAITGGSALARVGDLDGDGLAEIAAFLAVTDGRWRYRLAVIPGSALLASAELPSDPYVLSEGERITRLIPCDLDGDGLPELVTDVGIWAGADLLTPGAAPVAEAPSDRWGAMACLGDLDGDGAEDLGVLPFRGGSATGRPVRSGPPPDRGRGGRELRSRWAPSRSVL